jgi:hypothetical protein
MQDDVAVDVAFRALGLDWRASVDAVLERSRALGAHLAPPESALRLARNQALDFALTLRAHDAELFALCPEPLRYLHGLVVNEGVWEAYHDGEVHPDFHALVDDLLMDDPGLGVDLDLRPEADDWECAPTRVEAPPGRRRRPLGPVMQGILLGLAACPLALTLLRAWLG